MACNGHFYPTIEGISDVQGSLYRRGVGALNVYARLGFTLYCIFFMRLCSTLIEFKSMKGKGARDSKGFS